MLRPIPSKILRSTAMVKVCTSVDMYQNQTYTTYTVERVHLETSNKIVKTKDNTDHQLTSVLFADGKHSTPFAWDAMLEKSHEIGGDVRVIVYDQAGRQISGELTVILAEPLRDDTDHFHHWEIGLL